MNASRLLGAEVPAGQSYFEKSCLERVPIAAPAPSATVGPPQGAEVTVHAIAFT
jgi:hypothetical protein